MARSKKHVLNAAKQKISNELMSNYEKAVSELNKLLAECDEDGDTAPGLLNQIELSRKKVDEAHQKISDWKQKPRVKKKKAVTWSSDYEASSRPRQRIVKTAAYGDFKASSPLSKRPVTMWLEEGSLVCKRKQPEGRPRSCKKAAAAEGHRGRSCCRGAFCYPRSPCK